MAKIVVYNNEFIDVTDDYNREEGGERWIRYVDEWTYINVLHRMTGFGYMEWESAIIFWTPGGTTWRDKKMHMIRGDWRKELKDLTKDQLMPWYNARIEGNQISFDAIIGALKEMAQ